MNGLPRRLPDKEPLHDPLGRTVPVTRAIGEGLRGRDSQLDAAVAELPKTAKAKT